jgi:hypothetical protein
MEQLATIGFHQADLVRYVEGCGDADKDSREREDERA